LRRRFRALQSLTVATGLDPVVHAELPNGLPVKPGNDDCQKTIPLSAIWPIMVHSESMEATMRAGLPVSHISGGPLPKGGWFSRFSAAAARLTGRPLTFLLATLAIVVWGITGPIFHYSDTWQLVINTGTTIITFLMVFLIQNTQNRDTLALHVKLDEIILALDKAHNSRVGIEDEGEDALEKAKGDQKRSAI
jgi:low affinity Fe/Cu permease